MPTRQAANSVIYSLIETAKENGSDPYRCPLRVLQTAPQLSEADAAWTEKLLPANAPKECYMPEKIIERHLVELLLAETAVFYARLRLTLTVLALLYHFLRAAPHNRFRTMAC